MQVKFSLSRPSLTQTALGSQGADAHGSGTKLKLAQQLLYHTIAGN